MLYKKTRLCIFFICCLFVFEYGLVGQGTKKYIYYRNMLLYATPYVLSKAARV